MTGKNKKHFNITFNIISKSNRSRKKHILNKIANSSKSLNPPLIITNLSHSLPSLANYITKNPVIPCDNIIKNLTMSKAKINKSTNTIFSNNSKMENSKVNSIHSNGKFVNIINMKYKNNIRNKLFDENIQKVLNYKQESTQINTRTKFNGLNLSSHYLGNTPDHRFGIITNKISINKNIISFPEININTYADLINKKVIENTKQKLFQLINIPNHNNNFEEHIIRNFFPRILNNLQNKESYKRLLKKLPNKINNKFIEYSNSRAYKNNQICMLNKQEKNSKEDKKKLIISPKGNKNIAIFQNEAISKTLEGDINKNITKSSK